MKTKFSGILTLLLAFVVQFTFAQGKTISGTVSDENGLPLPTATVIIKGTTTGTSTDFDGNYSIAANQGDVLIFSYVGYANQNQTVGASNKMDVSLQPDNSLDEVVITALGIKRIKDELTTATKVVKAEELTQAESPNIVASLTGKVSGLQINMTNSGVNPTTRIVLRGIRSITGNNEALIVVDGAISTASYLQALDPKTIESVNVLKGANGAALYGSRGGNGVIIVNTKKGSDDEDKFKIDISSSVTLENIAFLPERQTSFGQGWTGEQYTYENGSWGPAFDGSLQPVGLPNADGTYNYYPYTGDKDNIEEFFQTGVTYQNSVSLSAGKSDSYINLFIGNQDSEFIIANDTYKRNTFSFKAGKKLGKFSVSGNATYIASKQKSATGAIDADGLSAGSIFEGLLETPTNVVVSDYSDGSNETHWNGYYLNPYWTRDNSRIQSDRDRINATAEVGYEVNDNINVIYRANALISQQGYYRNQNKYEDPDYIEDIVGSKRIAPSYYRTYNNNVRDIYSDLFVNFDYMLTDDISFKSTVGQNITDSRTKYLNVSGYDLTVPGFANLDNISTTPSNVDTSTRSRAIGVFGSIDLGYKDFLYVTATGRNDWTSVLDQENRSFFYPSVGVSFIPTKAFPAIKGNILNYAKLSANWVKVGSADVQPYDINATYVAPAGYPFNGVNSFIQSTSATDQLLQNQFVTSTEFNLNLEMFKRMVTIDASYYTGNSTEQIIGTTPSYTSGLASATINIGETKSTGFEVDLGLNPIKAKQKGDLDVQLNFSYSTNKTTVESLTSNANQLAIVDYNIGLGIFAVEGEEYPLIKGTGYARDDEGHVIINAATGNPEKSAEYVNLGKTTPDYILGFSPTVSYKGLRLTAVMDYRTGHSFYSSTKAELARSGYLTESVETGRNGGFIFPNSVIETSPGVYAANTSVHTGGDSYASYVGYYTEQYQTTPENFILDATAFKVREIALSYSLPEKLLSQTAITDLTLGVNARNLFSKFADENQGYNDPESSNSSGNDVGIAALSQYPSTRFYGFSVNLSF
ncbi:SusC/RagA family TonB-linked outer membrane protein [Lacinutrix himadriensis]|uniref:SusC/RagA family TonB-linked outer membrane protein n=1 Tax=Lacinutrix himadriensis TaxID=641549 RepID=UPI0006E1C44E|nr:SusC/RagA family TonB-linked outer membrane protein [Lacinutrix himadriensis]